MSVPPSPNRSGRGRIIAITGGVAVVAIVAVLIIVTISRDGSSRTAARDQVAVQYVNAINTGDPETVCRLETDRQRRGQSQEACVAANDYLRGRDVRADEPRVAAVKELADGQGVLVQYRLTTGGDTPSHDALRLVEADGTWLVDQAESVDADALTTDDPIGAVLTDRRPAS